jgi:hypothetical protein
LDAHNERQFGGSREKEIWLIGEDRIDFNQKKKTDAGGKKKGRRGRVWATQFEEEERPRTESECTVTGSVTVRNIERPLNINQCVGFYPL